MKILPLKFYENGYMQEAFAFGGSRDKEKINLEKRYPSSLQNYIIDTGKEVILIDTGLKGDSPTFKDDGNNKLFMGNKVANFVTALATAGYKPEDINKVIITHKHPDHSGELDLFTSAKIYISDIEATNMKLEGDNVIRVTFDDGPYKNFESSKVVSDNLYMLPAYGHTHGNSIAVFESDGLFYMFHGDVTYTDEALIEKELSIVFEDKDKAIQTLNTVREFVINNPTIYLSTHTPLGVESLKNKSVLKIKE